MSTNRIIPISLRKNYNLIRNNISQVLIIDTADNLVANEMNLDTLLGLISSSLLGRDEINDINDGSYGFKKNLLMYINDTIEDEYEFETKTINFFNKDGGIDTKVSKLIINQKDAVVYSKEWFKEVDTPISHLILKGSNKRVSNDSEKYLNTLASQDYMVRDIDHDVVRLYSILLYEANKNNVSESKSQYKSRLDAVAEETILYLGYEFSDTRKLDSSGRDYSLNRFGFASQYGDSFEKQMIQPTYFYTVNDEDIMEAKRYLCDEYKVDVWYPLYKKSLKSLKDNMSLVSKYNDGKIVEFSITHKELGKIMDVINVVNLIIYNKGNVTNQTTATDLTNSGIIMYANQFGDEKMMSIANLLGGDSMDSHVEVANFNKISRDEAKGLFVGSNHGARVPENMVDCKDHVFGERYDNIRKIAEYGIGLAKAGVSSVDIVAPDSVKYIWNPYARNCKVYMEDENKTMVHAIMPFTDGVDCTPKVSGLAVKFAHGSDSFVMRHVRTKLIDNGVNIVTILDAWYHRPSLKRVIIGLIWEAIELLDGWAKEQLASIERQTGIKMDFVLPERELKLVKTANIV